MSTPQPPPGFTPQPDFRALCEEMKAGLEAADRLAKNKYIPWSYAGGVNDCPHGYGEGIPCRKCDELKVTETITRVNAALKGDK